MSPPQDRFELSLELGNADMRRPEDVADVLRSLADRVEEGYTSGPLYDVNGNPVGGWEASFPPDEEEA